MGKTMSSIATSDGSGHVWAVSETPGEVQAIVDAALDNEDRWVELTMSDESAFSGGRPIRILTKAIIAIAPPLRCTCGDENEDTGSTD